MENRKELVIEIALLIALLGALIFGMYRYSQRADAAMDRYFQELRERRAAERPLVKLGVLSEQEELELLLMPLLPLEEPSHYVDREVQDWWDDHPFYEWGELV